MKETLASQTLDEFEQLLRIDSNSDNHASLKQAGEYVQGLLSDLPIDWETKRVGNSAEFFIGRTKEMDPDKPVFILSGHLDVVPDVKEPRWEGDHLYASGSYDMKGGLITMVEVVRALHEDGLCKNIVIALNPEEEIGNPNHSSTLSELAREGDFVMVFEGGDEEGLDKKTLVKSRKGAWVYKLTLEAQKDLPPGVLIERSLRLVSCLNNCVDYKVGTTRTRCRNTRIAYGNCFKR